MDAHRADTLPNVQIRYYGAVRGLAGKSGEDAGLAPDTTAYQLLLRLACKYGSAFRNEIFREDGESLRDDFMLTVNETIVKHADARETTLKQGDVIALFPIFPGGG